MKLFDLSYQLAYYKAYHMHGSNVAIHLWCIPVILFTAILLLPHLPVDIHWILIAVYSTYYIVLDVFAGLIATPFLVFFGLLASKLATVSASTVWIIGIIHVLAWSAQFYGHFHFEGKSPAVFDNLVQPLVLAPYFVLFEVLFLLGYRAELEQRMLSQARIKRSSL